MSPEWRLGMIILRGDLRRESVRVNDGDEIDSGFRLSRRNDKTATLTNNQ